MGSLQLKKSSKAIQFSILGSLLVVVVLCLLAMTILAIFLSWAPNVERFMILVTWVVLLAGWLFSSIVQLINWQARAYEVDAESIRLTKSIGLFKSTKVVYRYESIISVRMDQGFWGKRFGYGNIYFAIPKLEKEEVLRGIENPIVQLEELQARLHKRGADTQALIS
jgi:uncharacterized membrane protein YdbT with pleckstrin-like domain